MNLENIYSENIIWAVIGDVLNAEKYAYRIIKNFETKGYKVIGVTPYDKIDGEIKELKDIELNIEAVNLCVSPNKGYENLVNDTKHKIKYVIAQPGARSEKIKELCKNRGIEYIETCTLVTLPKRD